jgi:hypothetical protein
MKKGITLIALIGLVCLSAEGQLSNYSSYGFGSSTSWQPVRTIGLGYSGGALLDSIALNTINPALWTRFRAVSIQGQMFYANLAAPDLNYRTNFGRFTGFAFKLPLGRKIGIGLGLNPLTRMDATRSYVDSILFDGSTIVGKSDLYLTGGISEFFFGGGWRVSRALSLGVKASLLFGNYCTNYNTSIKGVNSIYSFWESRTSIDGRALQIGVLWESPRGDLHIAGSWEQALTFNSVQTIDYSYGPDTTYPKTTLDYPARLQLAFSKQLTPSLSVNFSGTYTLVKSDLFQKFYLFEPSQAQNGVALGVGIEYIPGIGKYFFESPKTTYRLGAFYRTEPISVNHKIITDQGVAAGLGFPIFNYLNRLDFAITYGLRTGFLTHERYLTFFCGLTTGELWFLKYKRR